MSCIRDTATAIIQRDGCSSGSSRNPTEQPRYSGAERAMNLLSDLEKKADSLRSYAQSRLGSIICNNLRGDPTCGNKYAPPDDISALFAEYCAVIGNINDMLDETKTIIERCDV